MLLHASCTNDLLFRTFATHKYSLTLAPQCSHIAPPPNDASNFYNTWLKTMKGAMNKALVVFGDRHTESQTRSRWGLGIYSLAPYSLARELCLGVAWRSPRQGGAVLWILWQIIYWTQPTQSIIYKGSITLLSRQIPVLNRKDLQLCTPNGRRYVQHCYRWNIQKQRVISYRNRSLRRLEESW